MNEFEFGQLRRGDLVLCEGVPHEVTVSSNDDRPYQSSRKDEIVIRSLQYDARSWRIRQSDCAHLLFVTKMHRYYTERGCEVLCANCARLSLKAKHLAGRYIWWGDMPRDQDSLECDGCERSVLQPVQDDDNHEMCSECNNELGIESTYCGSFCQGCLQSHLEDCDICRPDWE